MLRQRARSLQAAVAVVDAMATLLAFFVAYYAAGKLPERFGFKVVLPLSSYLWLGTVSVPMWWLLFGIFGCYDFSPLERSRDSLRRMALPLLTGALALGAILFFWKQQDLSRRLIGASIVTNVALLLAGRIVMLKAAPRIYRSTGALRRVLVIGEGSAALEFGQAVRQAGWGLELTGYVAPASASGDFPDAQYLGDLSALQRILDERNVDDVVLAGPENDFSAVQRLIQACEEVGVCIHIPASFFRAELSRPHLEAFRDIRMLTFSTTPYNPVSLGIKRGTDILGSVILGVLLSPLLLLIALLVRFTSRGPLIFKQTRSGLYGREFTMYKFRSMYADAEERRATLNDANEMDGPAFKMRNDPRVTFIGRIIRRYSLDELPQLWNVFKGEMSLVGPRPPLPAEVATYERWQRRRLSMRPGLTCIWQVTDRNKATFDQWMQYDLRYIDNWSLWLDVKLALQSIPAVLRGTGM